MRTETKGGATGTTTEILIGGTTGTATIERIGGTEATGTEKREVIGIGSTDPGGNLLRRERTEATENLSSSPNWLSLCLLTMASA